MTELVLGPIIGGLSSVKANLWGRADGSGKLHAWLGRKPDLSDAQLAGQSLPLEPENGYAGVAPIHDLLPDTQYYYWLTLDAVSPVPGQGPGPDGDYPNFKTFPIQGEPISFAFAFGSCFRPEYEEGGQIFNRLEARRVQDELRFILLIGDQIYADAYEHNGIGKMACTLDEYRAVYKYTWAHPPFRKLLMNLPAFMTLDDHEVDNDWRWIDRERHWAYIPWWDRIWRWFKGRPPQEQHIPRQRVLDALQAYWEHQVMHAPPFVVPFQLNRTGMYDLDAESSGALSYTFVCGSAAFFVLDTRSTASRTAVNRPCSVLGNGRR